MDNFTIYCHRMTGGHYDISAKEAAKIMGVTTKTARNYIQGKVKRDPVRMAYLRAVVSQRILPENEPLWWDAKTKKLCCNGDLSIGAMELLNVCYLRDLSQKSAKAKDETIKQLTQEIAQLRKTIKALRVELLNKKPAAPALPSNVIPFKKKEAHR